MKTTLEALWASITRTLVPIIVGAVLGWLAASNIPLDPEFEVALTALLTGLFSAAYYLLVRVFERYVSPKLGWLLGNAKQPAAYVGPSRGDHAA
jgi:cation transporter-like permease